MKKLAHALVHTSTWDFAGGGAPKRRIKFRNGGEYLRRTTKKWPDSKVRVRNTQPTYAKRWVTKIRPSASEPGVRGRSRDFCVRRCSLILGPAGDPGFLVPPKLLEQLKPLKPINPLIKPSSPSSLKRKSKAQNTRSNFTYNLLVKKLDPHG